MTVVHEQIIQCLTDSGGVLLLRQHPAWHATLGRMVRSGALVAVLPGAVVASGDHRFATHLLAVASTYPDGVVHGAAAARLTFWPDLPVETIDVARRYGTTGRLGFRFTRRAVPPTLIEMTGPVRHTVPALTAVDLCGGPVGADALDQVLRSRAATLAQLHEAFAITRGRRGNAERLRLLIDSRDEPWSAAERLTHRLLRSAGMKGWVANHPVRIGSLRYFLDVAFPEIRLAIEVESVAFHSSPGQLHRDRLRQNLLTAAGWTVLRIDWTMITDRPDAVIRIIRAALGA